MNSKSILANGAVKTVAVILSVGVVMACALYITTKSKAKTSEKFNPAFKAYISAYTGGVISREAPIQIKFVSEVVSYEQLNTPIEKELFKFSPSINGTAKWIDRSTIQFEPEDALNPGTSFEASFKIGQVMKMPEDMDVFDFGFQTVPQIVEINVD